MSIELHIERLVLDETLLGSERVPAVRAAIEQQLARLLAGRDAAIALQRIGRVASLPSVLLPAPNDSRDRLGSRIAMGVQRGMGIDATAPRRGPGAQR